MSHFEGDIGREFRGRKIKWRFNRNWFIGSMGGTTCKSGFGRGIVEVGMTNDEKGGIGGNVKRERWKKEKRRY